jgi:hypothetical protein
MIKTAVFAVAFALSTAGSAMAQGAPWCLQHEDSQSCTYSTLQQCLANRTGVAVSAIRIQRIRRSHQGSSREFVAPDPAGSWRCY